MTKERLMGFIVVGSLLAILLPLLKSGGVRIEPVSEIVIPDLPEKKLNSSLDKAEVSMLTELESTKSPSLSAKVPHQAWSIRLASFADAQNAASLVESLQHEGYSAYLKSYRDLLGRKLTRVYVGPFVKRDEMNAHQNRLRRQHPELDGVVVSFTPTSEAEDGST